VKHITLDVDDVPVIAPALDRRCTPDRRTTWRGGRRDTDWVARPPDAWERYAAGPGEHIAWRGEPGSSADGPAAWRRILASLHIFNL
jgi:hypothetical protein